MKLGPVSVRVGDVVIRNMCGIETELTVTEVTEDRIFCGPWMFDPKTGAEIDDQIPDIRFGMVISFIRRKDS